MQRVLIGIGILAIALTVVFEPLFGFPIQQFLAGRTNAKGLGAEENLALEVASLKTELAESIEAGEIVRNLPPEAQAVFVYSRYPFNFKNEIVLTAGKDRDIRAGDAVVLPHGGSGGKPILVGSVISVFDRASIVRTVFDPSFQIPVRAGASAVDMLFTGGTEPKLTLIPKTADVRAGDPAYAASPDMPYGLPVGTVGEIQLSQNSAFQESAVSFPYDLNALTMVAVMRSGTQ